jgi:NADH-quinone oxidoreductase subunit A
MDQATETTLFWPFLLYAAATILLVAGILLVSHFLGERHSEPATGETYESGITATGSGRLRFPVHFYIVAMFFVIFDLEAAFIIAWAVAVKQVGWTGYLAVLVFIGVLLVVLLYEWKTGALDFGPKGKKILEIYHKKIKKQDTV